MLTRAAIRLTSHQVSLLFEFQAPNSFLNPVVKVTNMLMTIVEYLARIPQELETKTELK